MSVVKIVWLLPILALGACGKDGETGESGVDTDSADSGDTSPVIVSDSGETGDEMPSIVVDMDADAVDGLSVFSLTWIDLMSLESDVITFGEDTIQDAIVSQNQKFFLREPLLEELQVINSDSGLAVAAFVGSIQRDNSGEPAYFGVAEQWVVYSNMEYAPVGISEGWNFFTPLSETFSSFSNLPMPSNLNPVDVLSFGGSYAGSGVVERRLVLVPVDMPATSMDPEMVWDSPIDTNWTCELKNKPPQNHFSLSSDEALLIAVEVPFSYTDQDGDGAYDETSDILEYPACTETAGVAAVFSASPSDLATALSFQLGGLRPGWMMMKLWTPEGESPFLDSNEAAQLQIGKDCLLLDQEPT